jgi:hypothetical protein
MSTLDPTWMCGSETQQKEKNNCFIFKTKISFENKFTQ